MADITLNTITSGYRATKLNGNFDTIKEAINNDMLHLEGGNNVMRQDIDLNSNSLLNVAVDVNDPTSVATVGYVDDAYEGAISDAATALALATQATADILATDAIVDVLVKNCQTYTYVDVSTGSVVLSAADSKASLFVLSNNSDPGTRSVTLSDAIDVPSTFIVYLTGGSAVDFIGIDSTTTIHIEPNTTYIFAYSYAAGVLVDITESVKTRISSLETSVAVLRDNVSDFVSKGSASVSLTESESRAQAFKFSNPASNVSVSFTESADMPAISLVEIATGSPLFTVELTQYSLTLRPGFYYVLRRTINTGGTDTVEIVHTNDPNHDPRLIESILVACSDETTSLTTGDAKVTLRAPYEFRLTGLKASLTSGTATGTVTVNIRVNGTDILSTPLTIDATETTSVTATTPHVFNSFPPGFDADEEIKIDIDGVGDGTAKGLKVCFLGYRV